MPTIGLVNAELAAQREIFRVSASRQDFKTQIVDETLNFLPFIMIEGDTYRIPSIAKIGDAALIPFDGAVAAEAPTTFEDPQREVHLTTLAARIELAAFVEEKLSEITPQMTLQMQGKAWRMKYVFGQQFIVGDRDTNPNDFNGLNNQVTAAQTIGGGLDAASGGASLDDLNRLYTRVRAESMFGWGGPDVYVCNMAAYRRMLKLEQDAGLQPRFVDERYRYHGVPVYVNDQIPSNEVAPDSTPGLTSVYALKLGLSDGVVGLVPRANPCVRTEAGSRIDANVEHRRMTWNVAIAVHAETAAARLNLFTPLTPAP